jgi:NADH:ubiquinone oxidoreductase subunit 3 (subunit A)
MILSHYAVVGLVSLMVLGVALLAAALWHPPGRELTAPRAWEPYRFGYPTYALIFLSFDMEMIFMYPWAVVFAAKGIEAFLDMFVFIAILSAGIAYAWGMGGLQWE